VVWPRVLGSTEAEGLREKIEQESETQKFVLNLYTKNYMNPERCTNFL
jgi:hypothetical protein